MQRQNRHKPESGTVVVNLQSTGRTQAGRTWSLAHCRSGITARRHPAKVVGPVRLRQGNDHSWLRAHQQDENGRSLSGSGPGNHRRH